LFKTVDISVKTNEINNENFIKKLVINKIKILSFFIKILSTKILKIMLIIL